MAFTPEELMCVNFTQGALARQINVSYGEDGRTTASTASEEPTAREFVARTNERGRMSWQDYEPHLCALAMSLASEYDGTNEGMIRQTYMLQAGFKGCGELLGPGGKDADCEKQIKAFGDMIFNRMRIGDLDGDGLGIKEMVASVDKAYVKRQNAAGAILDRLAASVNSLENDADLYDYWSGKNLAPGMDGAGLAWLQANEPEDYQELAGLKGEAYDKKLRELYEDNYKKFARDVKPVLAELSGQFESQWKSKKKYQLARALAMAASESPNGKLDYNQECRIKNAVLYGKDGGDAWGYDDPVPATRWVNNASVDDSHGDYVRGLRGMWTRAQEEERKENLDKFRAKMEPPAEAEGKPAEKKGKEQPKAPRDATDASRGVWKYNSKLPGERNGAAISEAKCSELKEELGWKEGDELWVRVKKGSSWVEAKVLGTYSSKGGYDGVVLNGAAGRLMLSKRGGSLQEDMGGNSDVKYFIKRKGK